MRRVSALFISLMFSAAIIAGENDFSLPIKVDSKSNFFDGKTKTSIFRKDVKITQGSLEILADEVEVIAGLGEGKEVFIARGKPAKYSQTLDDGSNISAAANEIKYEVSNRTLTLNGAAELNQDSSLVKGESIQFNMELEQLIAESDGNAEGGVTAIFQPESIRNRQTDDTKKTEEEQDKLQDEKP
ncbi:MULTISPECIES: lipopolysaccharide transport periplasmic protein LptA [Alteromonadaceae]|uniref:lipopolysaccharide transport periplasmic protein LptA n=1 Tax=Alteromonadaceae TaxID=72275 RepID=UPI001C07EF68|nr:MULTISPECIES: lipopolysaccharide transport periplasmic protein LptA [Aliiglaciecola]MBU2879453.1 lipopolysaccharide transport periplasmic protein LptA [Aliiglaciecola lipolytica]MDO6712495.1 lipopolysaccharide transport periplasmic protein LptA [Aliiglaciecola sp. 2_MG-2023]MDO6753447.1 lipopolysaccharide transport periplasmic protein LptA [Aliiglaciecola sp. 1_MG-2023]